MVIWVVLVVAALIRVGPLTASEGSDTEVSDPVEDIRAVEERSVVTHHTTEVDGEEIAYRAEAGQLILEDRRHKTKGLFFYVYYDLPGTDREERPVMFVFNGGPGAASAFLHLAAMGPKRVEIEDDGVLPSPPARLTRNEHSWLGFTDLVFIDPVGTGYSRGIPDEEEKNRPFWGVEEDVTAAALFIQRFLSLKNRWLSPKYLAGESYGALRVSALSQRLQYDFGIDLNGLLLISPALDYSVLLFERGRNLPYALYLPTYAAVARVHGQSRVRENGSTARLAAEVERFSLNQYLTGLVGGDQGNGAALNPLYEKISGYTGLPLKTIQRHRGRIHPALFQKELLRDQELIVSRMDGTMTDVDPEPEAGYVRDDLYMHRVVNAVTAAANLYLREELEFSTDTPYEVLNVNVNKKWSWDSALEGGQGYVDALDDLRYAMSLNQNLKVFAACGYYDMATPYLALKYLAGQMGLHEWLGSNIRIQVYPAGHMVYTHRQVRESLFRDAMNFVRETTPAK